MRLTIGQRLEALERDSVILHDTMELLHKLLKEQRELIKEYIVQKVSAVSSPDGEKGNNKRPEDELYTFICKRRFDKIDKDIKNALNLIDRCEKNSCNSREALSTFRD